MMGEFQQPKDRDGSEFHDDFGRPYDVTLDRRTMDPVGPVTPMFEAPFYVPPQHLVPVDPVTNKRTLGRLFIAFDAWERELREAQEQFDASIRSIAQKSFTELASDIIDNPTKYPRVMALAGRPPLSPRFVQALRAGNPWATGARPELDPSKWFSAQELAVLAMQKVIRPSPEQKLAQARDEFLTGLEDDGSPAADAPTSPAAPRRRGRRVSTSVAA